jgi:hypothetical protein
MTYSEKLKDLRWQKKRLEIFTRDSFTCQHCMSNTNTLHVHHKYYIKADNPWDYPEKALVTLCDECHEQEGELGSMKTLFIQKWCDAGLLNVDMEGILTYLEDIKLSRYQIIELLGCLSKEDFAANVIEALRDYRNRPIETDLAF